MGGVAAPALDISGAFVKTDEGGLSHIDLLVGGIHCPKCVRDIETGLNAQDGIKSARVNLSTSRLHVAWNADRVKSDDIVRTVSDLGFDATPIDAAADRSPDEVEARRLLIAMAVAGFAAANVMLLSVSVWAGVEMGPATRTLMHWISAAIALPAVAFSGRPFFGSAVRALKAKRLNMDVPISLAVLLACAMSIAETRAGGTHAYFDAAVMLLFFLLIGRYLDMRMRTRARSAANDLMALQKVTAQILDENGTVTAVPVSAVRAGDLLHVAQGARIPVDGTLEAERAEVDVSLLTGESLPQVATRGATLFAGAVNLTAPLTLRATETCDSSVLADIVRMMEAAEQRRNRYVRLADRAASIYAPTVHLVALITFIGWWVLGTGGWSIAATNAIAVLIITCPCALGLAVPVVQVVASGFLFRRGILAKSADGLERLAEIDTVVFDKTGTLTQGRPQLKDAETISPQDLALAASLARASRHPLSRALSDVAGTGPILDDVNEVPGFGMEAQTPDGPVRLGNRIWCEVKSDDAPSTEMELWLRRADGSCIRFGFEDALREDAGDTIRKLKTMGFAVELLSGDRIETAANVARTLGIETFKAACLPGDKIEHLKALSENGARVLMVGDGLNDAPALAAAHASMSPASAADISQTAADLVFQGESLSAIPTAIKTARMARGLVLQNFGLAAAYNMVAVPLAMAGFVTPLIAALAMSASSIVVTLNALRLNLIGGK